MRTKLFTIVLVLIFLLVGAVAVAQEGITWHWTQGASLLWEQHQGALASCALPHYDGAGSAVAAEIPQPPQEQEPAKVHPKFGTPNEALEYVGEKSLSVGEPTGETPFSPYYQNYLVSQAGYLFGDFPGQIQIFDVFGPQYTPAHPYYALLSYVRQFLYRKVWQSPAKNIISPAAGRVSSFTNVVYGGGPVQAVNGVRTDFVMDAYLAVADELTSNRRFSGWRLGGAVQRGVWFIDNRTIQEWAQKWAQIFAAGISTVNTSSQRRRVEVALFLVLADGTTKQAIWMNDGLGVAKTDTLEVSYREAIGFSGSKTRYPNSYYLAQLAVKQGWELPAETAADKVAGKKARLEEIKHERKLRKEEARLDREIEKLEKPEQP